MGVSAVNFFFDAVFVRTQGAQFRTPFHQDEPYWSGNVFDTCSTWMPLVPVEQYSALESVRGSHRRAQKYRQTNFGALTGDTCDVPNIEGAGGDYDIQSWDMEPGGLAVFCARTIHGGSGNLAPERGLKPGDRIGNDFYPELWSR
jgi:ectoine hydroxylase-related dioxygenase (phytanoyl-CoA dioxygenase family)